jgi:hypothetical protein
MVDEKGCKGAPPPAKKFGIGSEKDGSSQVNDIKSRVIQNGIQSLSEKQMTKRVSKGGIPSGVD